MNFYLSSLDLNKIILRTVCAVIIGGICCFFPQWAANSIVIVLGGITLFIGIVSFLTIFATKDSKPGPVNYFNLALSLLVGFALLLAPGFFVSLIMILLGILLVVCGIGQIASLRSVRKWGVKPNVAEYLVGGLLLALGVLICFRPSFGEKTLFILFGIGAVFYGFTNLIILLRLRNKLRKSGKTIVHGSIEDIDYELEEDPDKKKS